MTGKDQKTIQVEIILNIKIYFKKSPDIADWIFKFKIKESVSFQSKEFLALN